MKRAGAIFFLVSILRVVPSAAAQCNVGAQGVAFGTYDVFSSQGVDSTGNIAVTCDVSTPYAIAMSPGQGTYALRSMASGTYRLGYNLFTDASRATVWGDGTGGSSTVSGSTAAANYTVFGRIPARQNAHVGAYADSVTITLTF
ncbi:MAG TPA: spore coat U domain-containing protein [Usitatibacter sp.]|jgi:spore coat protein U-like protein|nr:spore coat U domain-containing protein [Usitatibacter sp.]